MRTEIKIIVPSDVALDNTSAIQLLLKDALGEFISQRGDGDAQRYVAQRYPYLHGPQQAAKVQEVQRRTQTAERIRHAIDDTLTVQRLPAL